jgi:hypothetical protein
MICDKFSNHLQHLFKMIVITSNIGLTKEWPIASKTWTDTFGGLRNVLEWGRWNEAAMQFAFPLPPKFIAAEMHYSANLLLAVHSEERQWILYVL